MDQENGFQNFRLRREEQIRSACSNQMSLLAGTLLTEPVPRLVFFFGKRHCHSVEVIICLATQHLYRDNISILVRYSGVTTLAASAVAQILCTHWHCQCETEGKLATSAPGPDRREYQPEPARLGPIHLFYGIERPCVFHGSSYCESSQSHHLRPGPTESLA